MKIDRLLSIIVYLLNHDLVSARVLSEKFEVTVRTIQRDMEAIDLAGIPIISIQGPNGGYGIMEDFKIDRQMVSVEDIYYIITSLNSVADTISDSHLDNTIEKMKTLLPSPDSDFLAGKNKKLSIDFSSLGGDPRHQKTFKIVKEAVDSERLLRFTYTSNKLEKSDRIVEPLTIAFKWRSWYLFGWCRMREDYRMFKISRIRESEIMATHFKRKDITFESYQKEQEIKTATPLTNLTLKFDSTMRPLVEEYSFPGDRFEESDGSLIVKTAMPEDGWMYSFLLSYGKLLTVVEPAHVRNELKRMTIEIAHKY